MGAPVRRRRRTYHCVHCDKHLKSFNGLKYHQGRNGRRPTCPKLVSPQDMLDKLGLQTETRACDLCGEDRRAIINKQRYRSWEPHTCKTSPDADNSSVPEDVAMATHENEAAGSPACSGTLSESEDESDESVLGGRQCLRCWALYTDDDEADERLPCFCICRPTQPFRWSDWLRGFLLAWATQYNLSEGAMDILLRALGLVFSILCTPAVRDWPQRLRALDRSLEVDEDPDSDSEDDTAEVSVKKYDRFIRYAMCPHTECGKLFSIEDIVKLGGRCNRPLDTPVERPMQTSADELPFPKFKDVREKARGDMCSTQVLHPKDRLQRTVGFSNTAKSPSAAIALSSQPILLFPYRPVRRYLSRFFLRTGYEDMLEHWRPHFLQQQAAEAHAHSSRSSLPVPQAAGHQLCDVYDGAAWKEYQSFKGKPLLSDPYVLALALNVDWFNPNDTNGYSIGAVFVNVLNVPRSERNLKRNTMLLGVLPGPRKTTREQLQSALKPFVTELLQLFKGVSIRTVRHPQGRVVRAFLMMVVCDVPAARETCGFGLLNATFGCTVCRKKFPRRVVPNRKGGGYVDMSGVDKDNWPLRTDAEHRAEGMEWARASNKTQRSELVQQEGGSRWSVLMEAPAFDSVNGVVIDVMHNIFLGLGKEMMSTLMESHPLDVLMGSDSKGTRSFDPKSKAAGPNALADADFTASRLGDPFFNKPILSASDLKFLQEWVDRSACPSSVGRIPGKIEANMSNFTAVEWANWMTLFSVPALRALLLHKDAELHKSGARLSKKTADPVAAGAATRALRLQEFEARALAMALPLFVDAQKAAVLVREYVFHGDKVEELDWTLRRIMYRLERMFGRNTIVPNQHLMCHLKEMILLYGPPAAWWCFFSERMNGALGRIPTNKSFIGLGMMKRWTMQCRTEQAESTSNKRPGSCADVASPFLGLSAELAHGRLTVSTDQGGGRNRAIGNTAADLNPSSRSSFAQYTYVWKDVNEYQTFVARSSDADVSESVIGSEDLPGSFRGPGTLCNLAQWDQADRNSSDVQLNPKRVRGLRYRDHVRASHLLNCLMRHYALAYAAVICEGESHMYKDADAIFKHPRFPRLDVNIRMFSVLEMAGDVYGSHFGCRTESNSFVAVLFRTAGKQTPEYSFGQIQFFLEHSFSPGQGQPSRIHRFALIKSYLRDLSVTEKNQVKLRHETLQRIANDLTVSKRFEADLIKAACKTTRSSAIASTIGLQYTTFDGIGANIEFPYVRHLFHDSHITELVPVHRIAYKFIPHTDEGSSICTVTPIPARTHC